MAGDQFVSLGAGPRPGSGAEHPHTLADHANPGPLGRAGAGPREIRGQGSKPGSGTGQGPDVTAGTLPQSRDGALNWPDRPALVVWASADRVMPPEHGRRLAALLPHGQLIEVDDSYTLIPLDQPARFAQLVREFTHASVTT